LSHHRPHARAALFRELEIESERLESELEILKERLVDLESQGLEGDETTNSTISAACLPESCTATASSCCVDREFRCRESFRIIHHTIGNFNIHPDKQAVTRINDSLATLQQSRDYYLRRVFARVVHGDGFFMLCR
jgi:hypothetical protein